MNSLKQGEGEVRNIALNLYGYFLKAAIKKIKYYRVVNCFYTYSSRYFILVEHKTCHQ